MAGVTVDDIDDADREHDALRHRSQKQRSVSPNRSRSYDLDSDAFRKSDAVPFCVAHALVSAVNCTRSDGCQVFTLLRRKDRNRTTHES
jgi:hypothetical protein